MTAEDFVRPHLLKLKAYTPIEPFEILAERLGRDAKDIVKLDANENPYGPPPEVLQALGSMSFPNIYPDPESRRLREALSKWHGVPAEHLLVSTAAHSAPLRALARSWGQLAGRIAAFVASAFDPLKKGGRVVERVGIITAGNSLSSRPPARLLQVGCGADELIDLLMRCVLDDGDAIVDCPPTFTMYAFDAAVNNARVVTVPRLDGFKIDVEGGWVQRA